MEPREEIKFTPDYEASEPVFWTVFRDLSRTMIMDWLATTNYKKRLISTGKLDARGSVLMIEHMEKTGKIEKTGDYNLYRMGKPVTT